MFDEEEEYNQPKIGFENPGHHVPHSDKPIKEKDIHFSNDRNTPYKRWTFVIFIIAMVTSFIAIAYFFLPFFSLLLAIVAVIVAVAIIVVPVVLTVGGLLLSSDFRAWCVDIWKIPSWLFNVTEHIAYFAQFFGIVSAVALFFDIASLILTSVGLAKKTGRYLTYLIFTIIMTIINAILVLVYISGGFQIVVTS
ncbi:MAG: hypothetical protein K6B51_05165 [Bacilli bacterium]|nr:hypothetical protein [Bacilli bacterium]